MALGDFRIADSSVGLSVAHTYAVKYGTANSIKAGEVVIKDGSNAGYVAVAVDGSASTSVYIGIAATTSTDTTTADGTVSVWDNPMATFVGKATTPANLARSLVFTQVTLDVTSTIQTIDENDTSNGTFIITDYNTDTDEVTFRFATNDHITAG
jgi:hypothetical protein